MIRLLTYLRSFLCVSHEFKAMREGDTSPYCLYCGKREGTGEKVVPTYEETTL
jgi:hypothetical protein